MSRMNAKPYWWQWKTSASPRKGARSLVRKANRRVRRREAQRQIDAETWRG